MFQLLLLIFSVSPLHMQPWIASVELRRTWGGLLKYSSSSSTDRLFDIASLAFFYLFFLFLLPSIISKVVIKTYFMCETTQSRGFGKYASGVLDLVVLILGPFQRLFG